MKKREVLKDGTEIVIRNLTLNDIEKMMKFYLSLPPEDRKYFRVDVTNRNVVEKRIKASESENIIRLIALEGDDIVGEGSLELYTEEWRKHQGEIRVIVSEKLRHRGLGLIIMRELCFIGQQKRVEEIVVKMIKQQVAARTICRKLGFEEKAIIHDYVRDLTGKKQDLIIMACDIKNFWRELEHFYMDSDWHRCR